MPSEVRTLGVADRQSRDEVRFYRKIIEILLIVLFAGVINYVILHIPKAYGDILNDTNTSSFVFNSSNATLEFVEPSMEMSSLVPKVAAAADWFCRDYYYLYGLLQMILNLVWQGRLVLHLWNQSWHLTVFLVEYGRETINWIQTIIMLYLTIVIGRERWIMWSYRSQLSKTVNDTQRVFNSNPATPAQDLQKQRESARLLTEQNALTVAINNHEKNMTPYTLLVAWLFVRAPGVFLIILMLVFLKRFVFMVLRCLIFPIRLLVALVCWIYVHFDTVIPNVRVVPEIPKTDNAVAVVEPTAPTKEEIDKARVKRVIHPSRRGVVKTQESKLGSECICRFEGAHDKGTNRNKGKISATSSIRYRYRHKKFYQIEQDDDGIYQRVIPDFNYDAAYFSPDISDVLRTQGWGALDDLGASDRPRKGYICISLNGGQDHVFMPPNTVGDFMDTYEDWVEEESLGGSSVSSVDKQELINRERFLQLCRDVDELKALILNLSKVHTSAPEKEKEKESSDEESSEDESSSDDCEDLPPKVKSQPSKAASHEDLPEKAKSCEEAQVPKIVDGKSLEAANPQNVSFAVFPTYLATSKGKPLGSCILVAGGVVMPHHYASSVDGIKIDGVVGDIQGAKSVKIGEDLDWYYVAIPGHSSIGAKRFHVPVSGERVGFYDALRKKMGVAHISDPVVGTYNADSDYGMCGTPLVNEEGFIVGIHVADRGFEPVTDAMIKFFRSSPASQGSKLKPTLSEPEATFSNGKNSGIGSKAKSNNIECNADGNRPSKPLVVKKSTRKRAASGGKCFPALLPACSSADAAATPQ